MKWMRSMDENLKMKLSGVFVLLAYADDSGYGKLNR